MNLWTHREYRTRLAWLDSQLNEPNRSDYYLMLIVDAVRNIDNRKTNRKIDLDNIKITFEQSARSVSSLPTRDIVKDSKRSRKRWEGMLGRSLGKNDGR